MALGLQMGGAPTPMMPPSMMNPGMAPPMFGQSAMGSPAGLSLPTGAPRPVSIGGLATVASQAAVLAAERARNDSLQQQQALPEITGLAGLVKKAWSLALTAKLPIEREMLEAVKARRGEYTSEKLAQIMSGGGSQIYMMLTSVKSRGASALLRDIVVATGSDRVWGAEATPDPELPGNIIEQVITQVEQEVIQAEMIMGQPVTVDLIRQRMQDLYDDTMYAIQQKARERVERMENKMEDQLIEGGWLEAMADFVDDMTIFKTAFVEGPVFRKRAKLTWKEMPTGEWEAVIEEKIVKEWKRVDPFMVYPAPWASNVNDAPLIIRRQLTRASLSSMIGAPGYSEDAIRKVLEQYGTSGLHQWLAIDSQKAFAEGKDQVGIYSTDTIDTLQFMGTVSGQMLLDWGMDKTKIPDAAKEYEADVWVIGSYVIKAVLNPDPLCRRPIFGSSYEPIPGTFWGNCLYDLIADCQDMCNAAARALANNLGICSGPQVAVNVERLPTGENITQIYPWKIWQFTSDPMNNTAQKAVEFFSPDSNANELFGVFDKFSILADEYSGVPRYMTGVEGTPGAGRTASGLSMMINNASKIIKQVLSNIDLRVIKPLIELLYYYNMRYETDPALKGDVAIRARGVMALVQKETAQVRRNEFLQVTANPIDQQIMGPQGRAYLLREVAKTLDVNADKVVPSIDAIKRQMVLQQGAAMGAQAAPQPGGGPQPGASPPAPPGNGQQLMNGAPVTDNFSPT